jgi:RimJ/RimL family protein N-acetyltransferase
VIQGSRVVLRAIERDDLSRCVHWLNNPTVLEFFGRYAPLSVATEERWFEEQRHDSSQRNFAIDLNGHHIGMGGFSHMQPRNRCAEVGLFIGEPKRWDQGLGTDALRTLVRFGFQEMNLHRIYLRVFAGNQRAVRCYTKIGFRSEGRWREAEYRHGRYHDLLWMSILHSEYQPT